MITRVDNSQNPKSSSEDSTEKNSTKSPQELKEKKQAFDSVLNHDQSHENKVVQADSAHTQAKVSSSQDTTTSEDTQIKSKAISQNTQINPKLNITQAFEWTTLIEQKYAHAGNELSQLLQGNLLDKLSLSTQSTQQTDKANFQQMGNTYQSACVHMQQHQDGSIQWRILNGALSGLEVTAQFLGPALFLEIKTANKKQKTLFDDAKVKLETIASNKRNGQPVTIKVIDGQY